MRQVMLYGPGDVRVIEAPHPRIVDDTDAIISIVAACICGSDLWPYRGLSPLGELSPMGHEYVGVVEEIGSAVTTLQVGQMVVGSFVVSDYAAPCEHFMTHARIEGVSFMGTTQAEFARVPHADGMLVPVGFEPDEAQLKSLLAASDVFGTAWFGAKAARVRPGATVAVVGDGAVGLCAVLSARLQGAGRIIAMSRHPQRQEIAREFGASEFVEERGAEGSARVLDLTDGLGADCVIEAVGMPESFQQAIGATKPGGHLGFVGVPHGVELDGTALFFSAIHVHGGPAPVRRYLPELIEAIRRGKANPGRVFTETLPLGDAARGYALMDQRKAIKVMLDPTR